MLLRAIVLFGFWVFLSGKLDAFHLSLGALTAIGASYASRSLIALPPSLHGIIRATWWRWFSYMPWLMWQIILSAIHVAKIVLSRDMPIEPHLVRFKSKLPNPVAHLTLANSITLTPGTVTLDVEGDEYVVHAIDVESGEALAPKTGEGEMPVKVAELFDTGRTS